VPELNGDDAPWAEDRLREVAAQYVEGAIRYMARQALLQP
jgi:hypothetical protein